MVGARRLRVPDGIRRPQGNVTGHVGDGTIVGAAPGSRRSSRSWRVDTGGHGATTGLDPELIVRSPRPMRRTNRGHPHGCAVPTTGTTATCRGGLRTVRALTGNIGRSGGGFSVYVGQYKVRVDGAPWVNAGEDKAKVVASIYFVRGPTPDMHPTCRTRRRVQGLVCTFANMFVQAPDVNRLHETLDGLDLIVVVDHQMTDTAATPTSCCQPPPGTRSSTSLPRRCTRSCSCSSRRSIPSASRAPSSIWKELIRASIRRSTSSSGKVDDDEDDPDDARRGRAGRGDHLRTAAGRPSAA